MRITLTNLKTNNWGNKQTIIDGENITISKSKDANPQEEEIYNNLEIGQNIEVNEWVSGKGNKYYFITCKSQPTSNNKGKSITYGNINNEILQQIYALVKDNNNLLKNKNSFVDSYLDKSNDNTNDNEIPF